MISRRQVGYLSSATGTYPDLTVAENLAFRAAVYQTPAATADPRIQAFLERAGQLTARNRLAGQLFGGMRQKLGVIAAMLRHPALLVLDEPTTGVDPVSRADLWSLIARSAAVVIATSYLDEADCAAHMLVLAGAGNWPRARRNRSSRPCPAASGSPGRGRTARPGRAPGGGAGRWRVWPARPAGRGHARDPGLGTGRPRGAVMGENGPLAECLAVSRRFVAVDYPSVQQRSMPATQQTDHQHNEREDAREGPAPCQHRGGRRLATQPPEDPGPRAHEDREHQADREPDRHQVIHRRARHKSSSNRESRAGPLPELRLRASGRRVEFWI
jgi:energy-coupling factor transporter ATP-binding protein EcfA2